MCAAKIKARYNTVQPTLYTFASPRVGDLNFANKFQAFNIESFRIANTEDIVPTVPLATSTLAKEPPIFFTLDLAKLTLEAAELVVATEIKTTLALITNNENFKHVGTPIYFTYQPDENPTIADIHNLEFSYIINFQDLARQ
ncbi:MAG: hypothetical protein NVS2B14_20070 [Chamaesiphon sp.]